MPWYWRSTDIPHTPDGNLSSGNVGACLDELQGDIDTLVPATCQGRLTLESGVAFSTTDQTAKSTLYFTPYEGNSIGLYDGSKWTLHTFTERSITLSGLTASRPYDVFIYNNSGTLTLELTAWTNDTTRATAITLQDGVEVKSGATTRRWVGTIYTTSTSTTEDADRRRYVFNANNQLQRRVVVVDSTSHTYAAGLGTRQWRAQSTNQIEFVLGRTRSVMFMLRTITGGGATPPYAIGSIGIDSTTAETAAVYAPIVNENSIAILYNQQLSAGRHFVSMNQRSEAATATYLAGVLDGLIAM